MKVAKELDIEVLHLDVAEFDISTLALAVEGQNSPNAAIEATVELFTATPSSSGDGVILNAVDTGTEVTLPLAEVRFYRCVLL